MEFEDLKKLKEQNRPYFMALMDKFDRYTPITLAYFLSQNPDSEEFVLDYVNARAPLYRERFNAELLRRKNTRGIESEVEDALIE